MDNVKHILISRIDNIGDVLLTLPMAGILKKYFPNVKITFLGRDYVRAIIEHCSYIDDFLSWDALSEMKKADAIAEIQSHQFDVVIHVYPKKLIGILMKKAKVPYRIASSSRFYYWFCCNKLVKFSRRKSNLHEAQLNLNLLKPFDIKLNNELTYLREKAGFSCKEPLPPHLQSILSTTRFNLIIHPLTNGNAREWPISHFIALINALPLDRFNIIITGSKKENIMIQEQIMPHCPQVTNFAGQCSLREFIQFIAHADGLIANSTGPMHMAAMLGIHTLGLFPITKGMDINRWAPLGEKAEVIIANPNCQKPSCIAVRDCFCMESITVDQVKAKILNWL
jgi:heptosyltransferase III